MLPCLVFYFCQLSLGSEEPLSPGQFCTSSGHYCFFSREDPFPDRLSSLIFFDSLQLEEKSPHPFHAAKGTFTAVVLVPLETVTLRPEFGEWPPCASSYRGVLGLLFSQQAICSCSRKVLFSLYGN